MTHVCTTAKHIAGPSCQVMDALTVHVWRRLETLFCECNFCKALTLCKASSMQTCVTIYFLVVAEWVGI